MFYNAEVRASKLCPWECQHVARMKTRPRIQKGGNRKGEKAHNLLSCTVLPYDYVLFVTEFCLGLFVFVFKKIEPFGLGLKTDKSNHFYNSVWFHKVLYICFFKQHKPKGTALPSRRATP